MNFRSFTNLGKIEKSDKPAITQQNGTNSEEAQKNDALARLLESIIAEILKP